jgi:hypothetical protein
MASQSQRRPWAAVLTVLALVAVATGLITASHAGFARLGAGSVSGVLSAPLTLDMTAADQLRCPSAPEYSADGSLVMVLAVQGPCEPPEVAAFGTHALAIYHSRTRDLQRLLYPDALLDSTSAFHSLAHSTRFVSYYSLGWAPDGQHVALIYTAFTSATRLTLDTMLDAGLLIIDVDHASGQVIQGDSGYFSALGGTTSGLPVWSLAQHMAMPAFTPEVGLSYAWGQQRQPYPILSVRGPVTTLPTGAGSRYPVGNPTSDSTFTIWQPGLLLGPNSSGTGNATFISTFPTWSANGATTTVMTVGVTLPHVAELQDMTLNTPGIAPVLMPSSRIAAPPRDAALSAVQHEIGLDGWALVAWNPDGSMLASVNCFASEGQSVEIRSTATGSIVGSAPLQLPKGDAGCSNLGVRASSGTYPGTAYALSWSPDGTTLLLSDRIASSLTQWQVSRLAH